VLILRERDIIGAGQFSDVFATSDGNRVCKIYRAQGSPKWRKWAPALHRQELAAYDRAQSDSVLCSHVPLCYGAAPVDRVLGEDGTEINDRYLLELGILFERAYGAETKATYLSRQDYPHVWHLIQAFEATGIAVGDASVMNYDSESEVRFIDLTTVYGARILAEVV
jgi:hypothetical protein